MAQVVGYGENNDTIDYGEGPFVIVNANGWRIECQHPAADCPVLPDTHVYGMMRELGLNGKTNSQTLAGRVCDELNRRVKAGAMQPW